MSCQCQHHSIKMHLYRGDLLRSITCVKVWHWKRIFSSACKIKEKCYSLLLYTKSVWVNLLEFLLVLWDYFSIYRCAIPWLENILKYNVSFLCSALLHCKRITICQKKDGRIVIEKIICLKPRKGHRALSHPDVTRWYIWSLC